MPLDTAAFVTRPHVLTSPLDVSPDGMVVLDTQQCVRYANTGVCAILCCTREDLLGCDLTQRFPAHEREAIREQIAVSEPGQPVPWSSVMRPFEGGERAVEYTPQPCVFDGHYAVVVTVRDVSEIRRLTRKALALERIAASMYTVKHAHARSVAVRLDSGAERLTLEVRDDGAGFDTKDTYPGHLGLHTTRERATRLGGTLDLESAPGAGTHIRAQIPCYLRGGDDDGRGLHDGDRRRRAHSGVAGTDDPRGEGGADGRA